MSYRILKRTLLVFGGVSAYVLYNYKSPEIRIQGEPYQVLPKAGLTDHPNLNFITKVPGKIGIVGGGIAGCITAKTLSQQGYEVEVLEKNSSFGGLWFQNYDGSGLQFHYSHYNLPDFSFPPNTPSLPKSQEVSQYIESYAKHFKIENFFKFNTNVNKIQKNSDETWSVFTENGEKKYDFLILCTGPYNKPFIPSFKGTEKFQGKIIHTSQFMNAEQWCKGKRVVVIGSGKSAFDIVGQAKNYGAAVTAVMRKAHWFVSPDLTILGMSRGVFTSSRMAGLFLDPFYCESPNRFFSFFSDWYWNFIESYLKDGLSPELLPGNRYKKEKQYRGGARDNEIFKDIHEGTIKVIRGKVDEFYEEGVVVDGKRVPADLVVYATGFEREYFGLKSEEDGLWMYRNTILPGVKNFAVVGIINTYGNPLYTNIQAVWLSEVLRGRVRLPGDFAMTEDIIRRKEYTRKIINGESTVSFSWFPYPQIDQFLQDMGLATIRKPNLFKYWFEPICPEDYKEVVTHRS